MRLTDIKGERGFVVFGEILEPLVTIFQDNEVREVMTQKNQIFGFAEACKKYPKELLSIMASINEQDVNNYMPNFLEIVTGLTDLMSDPLVSSLFTSQGQNPETNSGSASENTGGQEK